MATWTGKRRLFLALLACVSTVGDVPLVLHHQGRILVDSRVFEGEGDFKFALVDAGAGEIFWANASDLDLDGEPDAAVTLPVSRGLYSVLLGDASVSHMAPLTPAVFANEAVYLRIWFDDGVSGFRLLQPDHRLAAAPYAVMAAAVPDGAIDAAKLAPSVLAGLNGQVAALEQRMADLSDQLSALSGAVGGGSFAGMTAVSATPNDPALVAQGFALFMTVPAPGWSDGTPVGEPLPRFGQTGVWTSGELFVWGGELASGVLSGSGALYRPEPEAWREISPLDAPVARSGHGTAWTGTEAIVWGGSAGGSFLASGGAYDPVAQAWRPLPEGPVGRVGHVAAWTGSRFLVWGGRNATGLLAEGAFWEPGAAQWTELSLPGAPAARHLATGVLAGDKLLFWGGEGEAGPVGDGARLELNSGGVPSAWSPLSLSGAPSARSGHAAVWTGQQMVIWGGRNAAGELVGDGAAYDPATDVWEALPTDGAPTARRGHAAVWTGQEMLVVAGETAAGPTAEGHAYDPVARRWRALSTAGNPLARRNPTAVWTGTEILVFGGRNATQAIGSLERLTPQPTWYFHRKP
ncbi:MAG: hypothetical protein H7A45_21275 [Verrucomicrobiales bacterium]|nr:hypothetical protein [Verrucomicrobiales bacterium]MCP5526945.1 hypothetical protein [Verrucomicrobiales bacterium]